MRANRGDSNNRNRSDGDEELPEGATALRFFWKTNWTVMIDRKILMRSNFLQNSIETY